MPIEKSDRHVFQGHALTNTIRVPSHSSREPRRVLAFPESASHDTLQVVKLRPNLFTRGEDFSTPERDSQVWKA